MVKNKFTLTGTDNNGFRHRYSVKKNEAFKKAFVKFMEDLEFDAEKIQEIIQNEFMIRTYIDTEKDEKEIIQKINVRDVTDVCRYYKNKKYDVDVFYGKSRIIIVVRTKYRVPMVKHLENKSGWIKPFEIKKIKEERKKSGKPNIPLQSRNINAG